MNALATILFLFSVCAAAFSFPVIDRIEKEVSKHQANFDAWLAEHSKVYELEEYFERLLVFGANFETIEAHNKRTDVSYTMALNQYADLTWEEFKAQNNMGYKHELKGTDNRIRNVATELLEVADETLPESVDWVSEGKVTPVKNQGQCGSCWAFSTTGSVEAAHAIATGELISLSEQELVDCSTSEGDHGCSGGLMDFGFQFIMDNGGLDTEDDYPYTAVDGSCQRVEEEKHVVTISGYKDVPEGSESGLKAAVAIGPVSVAIEADQAGFQFYSGGVYDDPSCGTQLDHGVLAAGYGTEDGKDYWLVKNSWGESWGDSGYIKLARGVGNGGQCGIALSASYPEA